MSAPHLPVSTVRGILLRERGDTLVVRASDDDVRRFAAPTGSAVTLTAPPVAPRQDPLTDLMDHRQIYDRHGRAVGVIDELSVDHDSIDVTTHGGAYRRMATGVRRATLRATLFQV